MTTISRLGIDIAKNSIQLNEADHTGFVLWVANGSSPVLRVSFRVLTS